MKSEHISDTISKVFLENGDCITLVGTAHVSQNSVDEVRQVIEDVQPDHICLELDKGRYESKTKETDYNQMDLRRVFKEGKAFLVLANTALASFQKKLGNQTGSAPGDEILSAGDIAQEKGIEFSLCDRDISVTLKRAWRLSGLWNKAKLIGTLISAAFDKEEIKPEELEELKKTSTLQEMLNGMAKELPAAKTALIDERDRYLATSIMKAPGHNKVAVIGAGHAGGIISTMEKLEKKELSDDLSDISVVPAPSKASKVISWAIPIAIVAGLLIYGALNTFEQSLEMFGVWAGVNALSSLVFTALSLGHPLTCLVAALAAPVSVMSPVLGVGMFTAITEIGRRKPTVKDYEKISDDIGHFSGWFKNRVLHAFLLFFTSSLGSIIGTVVLSPIAVKLLGIV